MTNPFNLLFSQLSKWPKKISTKLSNSFLFSKEQKTFIKKQFVFDKKLVLDLQKSKVPTLKQLKHLPKLLSPQERWSIIILSFLLIICLFFLSSKFYTQHIELVPDDGGEYVEGLIGTPKYINPILSQTSDVDIDLTQFIFSGLLKYNEKQELIPEVAEKFTLSEDQKIYTFYLKNDILWHDGKNLKADDVIFTVKSIQNSEFKSPLYLSFKGVEIEKIDDYSLKFILSEPYTPFLGVLTFGILPEHLWYNIPASSANLAEYNLKPIGSGPWKFDVLTKDKLGNLKSYTLARNENYYGQKSHLEKLTFRFYPNFEEAIEALKNKNVQGISFLPQEFKEKLTGYKNINYYYLHLPQYTAIFFNQKKNEVLKINKIREALAISINKEKILREALDRAGDIIHGPILPGFVGYNPDIQKFDFDPGKAKEILDELSWKKLSKEEYYEKKLKEKLTELKEERKKTAEEAQKIKEGEENNNTGPGKISESAKEAVATETPEIIEEGIKEEMEIPKTPEELIEENLKLELEQGPPFYREKDDIILKITLSTVDQPEKIRAAEIIKEFWQNIGFQVNLNIINPTKIKNEVIKPREYEAFLYGIVVGADPDPYPFWHSSQNEDPGVNLAIFSNKEVDELLEDARQMTDEEQRRLKYKHFQNILVAELPAIFLYNPLYTYVVDERIKGINLERIISPADRFANIEKWYVKTKRAWHW